MKIKPLTKEQIIISIDRLTRFKEPELKYLRVFKDIISSNLIEPKFKKTDLENLDYSEILNYAQKIINSSLDAKNKTDFSINEKLYEYENSVFKIDNNVNKLLKNKINYVDIIDLLPNNLPDNLLYLKSLKGNFKNDGVFPIKKLILCEGITEEILLPKFAKMCDCDLKENGIYIISAGGKNQVVKYFYNYADSLKIPIFVLLDKDANDNFKEISPRLRNFDKIHLLKSGEFEDLLPESLIIKTLKYTTENISLPMNNISDYSSNVEFLEEFYRHRGMHEFKKSEFANAVKENISDISDVSSEIKEIFHELNSF